MDPEQDELRRDLARLEDENRRLELLGLVALSLDANGPMLELSDSERRPGQREGVRLLRGGLREG